AVEPRLDGIKPRVNGIEPRVNGIEPRVDGREPRVDPGEPSIDGIEPSIDGVEPRVDTSELRVVSRLTEHHQLADPMQQHRNITVTSRRRILHHHGHAALPVNPDSANIGHRRPTRHPRLRRLWITSASVPITVHTGWSGRSAAESVRPHP